MGPACMFVTPFHLRRVLPGWASTLDPDIQMLRILVFIIFDLSPFRKLRAKSFYFIFFILRAWPDFQLDFELELIITRLYGLARAK